MGKRIAAIEYTNGYGRPAIAFAASRGGVRTLEMPTRGTCMIECEISGDDYIHLHNMFESEVIVSYTIKRTTTRERKTAHDRIAVDCV